MDDAYKMAMREHIARLAEELSELKDIIERDQFNTLMQRAAERTLQVLVEACIGIAKQRLKAQGKVVPTEAREAFTRLRDLGMDHSGTDWRKVVGLRNALVHDYLNLDPDIIKDILLQAYYQSLLNFAQEQLKA